MPFCVIAKWLTLNIFKISMVHFYTMEICFLLIISKLFFTIRKLITIAPPKERRELPGQVLQERRPPSPYSSCQGTR